MNTNLHLVKEVRTDTYLHKTDDGRPFYVRHLRISTEDNGDILFTLYSYDQAKLTIHDDDKGCPNE